MPSSLLAALVDLRPLREHRVFRRLWLSTTASGLGGQLSRFAVIYYVWDRTHNPALVGIVGLCAAGPLIGFALLGTAFADHVDRRRLALLTTIGQLGTGVLMAVVAAATAPVWTLLILVGVGSGLSAVGGPARRAMIPRLLPPERLAAGLALNHLSFQLMLLLGPVLAGVLTARWGTTVCFAGGAAASVAALAGIAGLPTTGPAEHAGRPGARAVWDGIRFTIRTPAVRGALLADLTATALAMPVALFPVINEEKFGGTPEVLGLFFAAVGAGGLVASVLSGLITRHSRPGVVLLACGATWGAALAAVAPASHLPTVLGLLAVAGAADTWAVVSRGTVVQSSTPEAYRGRVAALELVAGAAGPDLGNLRAGLVAAGTSGGASLAIGGAACLAGIGLLTVLNPPLRQHRSPRSADPSRPTPSRPRPGLLPRGGDARLVPNGKVDGVGDEARPVRARVQAGRRLDHRRVGDRDLGAQHHLGETGGAALFPHGAGGPVDVAGDHDAVVGAQVQVPQHVALRQRRHQQLLRVPPVGIAAKHRIGTAGDGGTVLGRHLVLPAVRPVTTGPGAPVTGPGHHCLVGVLPGHGAGRRRYGASSGGFPAR